MPEILPSTGCLYSYRPRRARGSFRLSPALTGADDSPVLIQGAMIQEGESYFKTNTLLGTRILYSFGSQMGNITIPVVLLLGKFDGQESSRAWAAMMDYYEAHKLSKRDAPIQISMPGGKHRSFFLVGMSMDAPNPQFNIASASLTGVLIA